MEGRPQVRNDVAVETVDAPPSSSWVRDLLGSAGAAAATVFLLFLVFEGLEQSFVRSEGSLRPLSSTTRGVSPPAS